MATYTMRMTRSQQLALIALITMHVCTQDVHEFKDDVRKTVTSDDELMSLAIHAELDPGVQA